MTDAQEIVWGPAIAVDGKRPGWLNDDEKVDLLSKHRTDWYSESVRGLGIRSYFIPWEYATAIRLPADHPHYRQPAPIDWSGELEAVHEDGRVVEAKRYVMRYEPSWLRQVVADNGMTWAFDVEGECVLRGEEGWRIRNVPQPTPQADTKPDVTARMEALFPTLVNLLEAEECEHHSTHRGGVIWTICDDCGRKWADDQGGFQPYVAPAWLVEARAIVALLPEPVDPVHVEARMIAQRHGIVEQDERAPVYLAIEEALRGRELALAGEMGR